jgi:hypothetical protein
MYFEPHEVLLTLELKFRDELSAVGVRGAVARLQKSARKEHPDITRIYFASESVAQDDPEGAADEAGAQVEHPTGDSN